MSLRSVQLVTRQYPCSSLRPLLTASSSSWRIPPRSFRAASTLRSTSPDPTTRSSRSRSRLLPLAGVGVVGLSLFYLLRDDDSSPSTAGTSSSPEDGLDHAVILPPSASDANSRPLRHVSTSQLLRSYAVYLACGLPSLVDASPVLLSWAETTRIPGVWAMAEWIIRNTFFSQFVGAEDAKGCVPLVEQLARSHIGSILVYSVECAQDGKSASASGDESSASAPSAIFQAAADEFKRSIDVAASVCGEGEGKVARPGSVMVAIKVSGLLKDPSVLERASSVIVPREHFSSPPEPSPPVSVNGPRSPCAGLAIPVAALDSQDVRALKELWHALRDVAAHAESKRQSGISILVDAEYSWMQPAVDAFAESLAAEFNRPDRTSKLVGEGDGMVTARRSPLVYNTFQAYLRRTPSHLSASLERARAGGYSLGVKLVRGAYVDTENAAWASIVSPHQPQSALVEPPPPNPEHGAPRELEGSPVWSTKALTDACYDACALRVVDEISSDIEDAQRKGVKPDMPPVAMMVASHNVGSSFSVARHLVARHLASEDPDAPGRLRVRDEVRGRLCFAQLHGMADDLTRRLQSTFAPSSGDDGNADAGPEMVFKYIPYGALELVMPYLVRRALENKAVMGGGAAQAERRIISKEMRQRVWEAVGLGVSAGRA